MERTDQDRTRLYGQAREGQERRPLGKYLLHGVSHHVGLDVHDPGPPNIKLEAGMVLTVEPGVYIKDENIGIRIEDVILVTESGASGTKRGAATGS
jgi:Xaa-Pro aminopeptidase